MKGLFMNLELFYLIKMQTNPLAENDEPKEKPMYIGGPYSSFDAALREKNAYLEKVYTLSEVKIVKTDIPITVC